MEKSTSPPLPPSDPTASTKRKRSPSLEETSLPTPPPAKTARPNPNQLQINYLARQFSDILPLVTAEDTLPSLLSIINDYEGVLHRHESMAGNLGARPLGPILIQRFERIFDGPPKVLKNHGKEGTNIGWLDVVEFARNKPEQFNLEKMRDGVRVCQFYTKQCRVEISEEDYLLIASGMPQRLIPPQPIEEDEEKELGTLEILEKNLGSIVQAADQVSARARQLNHRLKNRKSAIISRREAESSATQDEDMRSPIRTGEVRQSNGEERPSVSPTSGFTAVNNRSSLSNGQSSRLDLSAITNGIASRGASAATRAELLSKFHTSSEREAFALSNLDPARAPSSYNGSSSGHRPSLSQKPRSKTSTEQFEYSSTNPSTSGNPVAIPHTPTSLLPYTKPAPADRFDDSGPYKAEMMLRMEQLNRGDRVQPPCDRCRRLHMDCLKNLTACMGCTKKHAKCSWKDVEEQELKDHPFVPRVVLEGTGSGAGSSAEKSGSEGEGGDKRKGSGSGSVSGKRDWSKDGSREVRDEELLGESSDEDGLLDATLPPARTGDKAHSDGSQRGESAPAPTNGIGSESAVDGTHLQSARSPTVTSNEDRHASPSYNQVLPPQSTYSKPSTVNMTDKTILHNSIEKDSTLRPSPDPPHTASLAPTNPANAHNSPYSSSYSTKLDLPSTNPAVAASVSLNNAIEHKATSSDSEARRKSGSGGMRWDEETGRMMLDS